MGNFTFQTDEELRAWAVTLVADRLCECSLSDCVREAEALVKWVKSGLQASDEKSK